MTIFSKLGLCVVLVFSFCGCHSTKTISDKYRDGQVWRYQTRTGEEQSRLFVEQVLIDKGEEIIFVAANNLHITNPSGEGEWTSFSSFPFTRDALDSSVTELERTSNAPIKIQGDVSGTSSTEWRRNEGEPFRISVAEFVRTLSTAKLPNAKYDSPLNKPLQEFKKEQ